MWHQILSLTEVVALLKSSEVPNTVEVQGKGYSYELTLPENFEETWNTMEACRRQTTAQALQQVATSAIWFASLADLSLIQEALAMPGRSSRRVHCSHCIGFG